MEVSLAGTPLGLVSIARADLVERAPFVYVSGDRRRLDVERLPDAHRDRIRLAFGGRQLRAVFLSEYAVTGYGVPVLLFSDERSFALTDPGPGGRDLKRSRAAAAAAAWEWAESEVPGVLPLAAEARDLLAALRARTLEGLTLPGNYALRPSPLDLIGFLTARRGSSTSAPFRQTSFPSRRRPRSSRRVRRSAKGLSGRRRRRAGTGRSPAGRGRTSAT